MKPLFSTILFILALFISHSLPAAIVVSWGTANDIVSSSTGIPSGSTTSLNLASLSNPAIGPSYYPNNSGKTPEFYGAGTGNFRLRNEGIDNIGSSANGVTQISMIALWTQPFFINGGDVNPVTLTGMDGVFNSNGGTVAVSSRFVIRLGSDFYVSDAFGSTPSFNDPTAINWFNYDPTTDYTAVGAPVLLADFSNLTAAGAFLQGTRAAPGTAQIKLQGINVDGTVGAAVIPEPSWLGLIALGGSLGLVIWRRRQGAKEAMSSDQD